jgi:hypothetical protein
MVRVIRIPYIDEFSKQHGIEWREMAYGKERIASILEGLASRLPARQKHSIDHMLRNAGYGTPGPTGAMCRL